MPGWWWNTLGLVFGTGLGMWLVSTIPGPENRTNSASSSISFIFWRSVGLERRFIAKNLSLCWIKRQQSLPILWQAKPDGQAIEG
jgi:hypothetical protein